MKFLIDENLAHSTVAVLREAGHDAERVSGGADDRSVLAQAIHNGAVLVTADLDFADVRAFPLGTHAGIIVLRLPHPAIIRAYNAVLTRFLQYVDVALTAGNLTIVQHDRYRIIAPDDTHRGPLFGHD